MSCAAAVCYYGIGAEKRENNGMVGRIMRKKEDGAKEYRYRYELKFLCTQLQIEMLCAQLDVLMEKDPHSGADGLYTVRSLYFDDYGNSAMKQKEDGLDERKKYRIRSYLSGMDERFRLEIKYRNRDKIRKESCHVTAEEVEKILRGEAIPAAYDSGRAVLAQFELARERMLLAPAVIVEYDRTPYVYPEGNVRITMDRNICASPDTGAFLRQDIVTIPVLERNIHLLEVKYDEYLPDFLRQALQTVSLDKISFSKYYLCRMAGKPLRMSEREQE